MRSIIFLSVLLAFARCGDETPDPRTAGGSGGGGLGSGDGTGTAQAQYAGPWEGFAFQRQDGKTLFDTQYQAKMEFKSDSTFTITLPTSSGSATGTYQSIQPSNELHLNLASSNLSLVGETANKIRLTWVRMGTSLTLTGDRAEFRLSRPVGYKEPDPTQPPQQTATLSMNGIWSCDETDNIHWTLSVANEDNFAGLRYSGSSSSQATKFSGKIVKDVATTNTQALMVVTASDDGNPDATKYRLTVIDATTLTIGKLPTGATGISSVTTSFNCKKK